MPSVTIHGLPNELLAHILSFLDLLPPYFEERLHDDPAVILNDAHDSIQHRPLKASSLVCRLWRRSAIPLLFRHVVWSFQRLDQPPPGAHPVSETGLLGFLRRTGLAGTVEGLTIVVTYPEDLVGRDSEQTRSYGVFPHPLLQRVDGASERSCNWFWHALFGLIDPRRITLVSSPAILARLLDRPIDLRSSWAFRMRFHVLSLSRDSRSAPVPGAEISWPAHLPVTRPSSQSPGPCDLFTIRNWSSLLLNEGSFGHIYGTYEYFNHPPPSLLPALLNKEDPCLRPLLHGTLRSLSYVAIFPLSSHIGAILSERLPPVAHLHLRISPGEPSFFSNEYIQSSRVDLSDLWLEHDGSYACIAMAARNRDGAWGGLRELESSDTKEDAWGVMRSELGGIGWRVEGEGLMINERIGQAPYLSDGSDWDDSDWSI